MTSVHRAFRGARLPFAVAVLLAGASAAAAAPTPSATLSDVRAGVRVAVAVTGRPLPSRVTVRAGRVSVRLAGRRAAWRSPVLTRARARAFRARVGRTVTVVMRVGTTNVRRRVVLRRTQAGVGGGGAGGAGVAGGAPGTTTGGAAPGAPGAGGTTVGAAPRRFAAALTGSRMTRTEGSVATRFDFCDNGTGFAYAREGGGTGAVAARANYWVTSAAFGSGGGSGVIEYRAAPGDTPIGASGRFIIRLGSGVAWIGDLTQEYRWRAGAAAC